MPAARIPRSAWVLNVFKTISYPEWFQYPTIPQGVRQQLVDLYSTRAFLASMDSGSAGYQRCLDAGQLIVDLLGTSTVGSKSPNGSIPHAPTHKEINDTLKNKLVPQLVQPRKDYENDKPSDREADYGGPSGYDIWRLDLKMKVLAYDYKIPTGDKPPSSFMTPPEREARQRNEEIIRRETLDAARKKKVKAPNACEGCTGCSSEKDSYFCDMCCKAGN
jgi:hypothetical protein